MQKGHWFRETRYEHVYSCGVLSAYRGIGSFVEPHSYPTIHYNRPRLTMEVTAWFEES